MYGSSCGIPSEAWFSSLSLVQTVRRHPVGLLGCVQTWNHDTGFAKLGRIVTALISFDVDETNWADVDLVCGLGYEI